MCVCKAVSKTISKYARTLCHIACIVQMQHVATDLTSMVCLCFLVGSGVVYDWRLDYGGCYQTHYADSLHYQLGAAVQLDWPRQQEECSLCPSANRSDMQ